MPQQTVPEQNMECENTVCQPVQLQPFIHQVGGHTSMFRFNENTVCKPLCTREYQFYSTLPQELRPFTPECRGVVKVEVSALDGDGFRLMAHRLDSSDDNLHYDNRHLFTSPEQPYRENVDEQDQIEHTGHEQLTTVLTANQNPWVQNIFNRQMRRLNPESSNKFILLENMVAQFTKPCVMDLKMGQRQHGDDASPEKRQLFLERCKSSTSNQLGVRASGMQVYQVDTGEYIYFSKYDGRVLTTEGFRSSLGQFLHNGRRLRHELITPIVSKLQELLNVVKTLDTFRFYSSSLLIMYDGVEPPSGPQAMPDSKAPRTDGTGTQSEDCNRAWPVSAYRCQDIKVDVRMVDFAHSTYKGFQPGDADHSGSDDGYLHGLSNLQTIFQELHQ